MKETLYKIAVLFVCVELAWSQTPEPEAAFLRERVSITTKTGVTGIPQGTRVSIIARHGNRVTVKVSDQQFEIAADQMTADPKVAETLRQQDTAQQQMVARDVAVRKVSSEQAAMEQQKQIAALAAKQEEATKHANSPQGQIEEIHKQITLLELEMERIRNEQKYLPPPNGYKGKHHPYRGGTIATSPNSFALEQRRREVEKQLLDLRQQETLLKLQSK